MATISFEKEVSLSRSSFKDVNDFFVYYLENYSLEDEKVEMGVLDQKEITPELQEKIKQAKAGKIKFLNI